MTFRCRHNKRLRKPQFIEGCSSRNFQNQEGASELDHLAEVAHGHHFFRKSGAMENYLEYQKWQTDHIEIAMAQADAGIFVSDEDVSRVLKKWH